ncbi:SRPBCC family protein [Roseiflexus sp.]|uniref:SRPBCC family protein n=1 Tax=Roseiflexus sp. TaxID=2562120 RepID=UPI0025910CAE|nr:SRPBCC family protein [Roseiflexus sp.]
MTDEEDKTICENNQRGFASRRYIREPYATTEGSVERIVAWYLRQIAISALAP